MVRLSALFSIFAVIFAAGLLIVPGEAEACAPMGNYFPVEVDEDTPECIELQFQPEHASENEPHSLVIANSCETDFEMEAVDCEGCDTSIIVAAPETDDSSDSTDTTNVESLTLEGRDWSELESGQEYDKHYTWSLGDQEGIFEATILFNNHDDADYGGGCAHASGPFGCSTAGGSLPKDTLIIVALLAATLAFRRVEFGDDVQANEIN